MEKQAGKWTGNLRLQLARKRLRDIKLFTKIKCVMFMVAILAVFSVGSYSYRIAGSELLDNIQDAVYSLEKQGGRNLDDRINSFESTSYRILQATSIEKLLDYSREEALRRKTANDGLPSAIIQQSSLTKYTKYAFLRPNSNVVYDYYRCDQEKMSADKVDDLLNNLESMVDKNHPTKWVMYDGQIYFIRKIVSISFQEKGILCFSIDESFFEILGQDMDYLTDSNAAVLTKSGEILKADEEERVIDVISDFEIQPISRYYIYSYEKLWGDEKYTVTVLNTQNNGWTVISYFSHNILLEKTKLIYTGMAKIIAFFAVLIILITSFLSKTMTKNIRVIEAGMKKYEAGDFSYRISPVSYDEIGLLGLQLNYMAMKINELVDQLHMREEEKRKLEIETLQAQINPHFLYNTLGSLKWQAYREKNQELAGALDALIQLLRFTIKKAGDKVSIREEIAYIRNYITVEQMRYGDQFTVSYEIEPETEEFEIPGFVLQPLVENSLIHGIDMSNKDGKITVRSFRDMNSIVLQVEDNGAGIAEERISSILQENRIDKKEKGLNSIGMSIVDRRLREIYGPEYKTVIQSRAGEGTVISLMIPMDCKNVTN